MCSAQECKLIRKLTETKTSQPLHPGGQNYPNEGSRGANGSELERNNGIKARVSGRTTGEPGAASNGQDLLMENGIDPGNLSPSQLVSFERQTLEVQQKSIQIYAANVAKAQAKLGTSNRKA